MSLEDEMSKIVEVNDEGELTLPRDVLGSAQPHARYEVDANGALVVLHLIDSQEPFWSTATADEWIDSFRLWMDQPRPHAPALPDEAFGRECIYD
jgi:hypothetical protein